MRNFDLTLVTFAVMMMVAFVGADGDKTNKAKEALKCHQKGFKTTGMDEDMAKAYQKCADLKLKSKHCLVSCVMQETGIVENGKWQEDKAKSALDKMWDTTQPDQEEMKNKLWNDSKKCLDDFAKSGKQYPTDYTGDCKDIISLEDCAAEARKCPKV